MNPSLASNKSTTTACSLTSLVQYYKNNILPGTMRHLQNIRNIITSSQHTDAEKAKTLLIGDLNWYEGCHQWYLKIHPALMDLTINNIVTIKPWNINLSKFHSFEDVYKYIHNLFARPYICQLTIYDITFRLLYALGATQLYPKDLVYVHAKAAKGYQKLINKGYMSWKMKRSNDQIPIQEFQSAFGTLESYWIEDMLCAIGKGMIII